MKSSLPLLLALALSTAACDASQAAQLAGVPPDPPLAPHQEELLELAFDAASALPSVPHAKTRSRVQQSVVEACLELDQPERATRYAEQIEGWRRGAAHADLALHLARHQARHGSAADVQRHLDLALEVARTSEDALAQEWRRDRIRAKVAQAHLWLGQEERAAECAAGLVESESGRLLATEAELLDEGAFERWCRELDAILAGGSLDRARGALDAYATLYRRAYGDDPRRAAVEGGIRGSLAKVPRQVGVDLLARLAGVALDHGDRQRALELAGEARALVDGATWLPEDHLPMLARLAALRSRAGEEEEARRALDAALATFEARREGIVDIDRAATLRPLAEAYLAVGDVQGARKVYTRAVEEGMQNPNSRPRAEDLSATCLSMALHGFEPDPRLRARLHQVRAALREPW